MSKLVSKIKERLSHYIVNDELSNEDVVDICKHALFYLNPTPVKKYAEENGKSRQGVYKFCETVNFFGRILVIDNY